jgi:hypothetical protein
MLPSVRPLMQRWSCGPVWEFADRNQIINACSRHDEYIWFFRPRLADCCAIPSFDRLHLRRPQVRAGPVMRSTTCLQRYRATRMGCEEVQKLSSTDPLAEYRATPLIAP